ncbi:MAG: NADH-quinone oxidoreductase subunit NuoG [Candidatus Poribacteria bacterium]|nr:NADH-quinone oxidoreductase subunit NuoG [Candidatus Poribacteria bacterium]
MATIYIDNKPFEVADDQNLLQAVLSLGLNLPYFCWHPALGSVGACRQCAIKQFRDEEDSRGKIVMACMTPVNSKSLIPPLNETRISVDDEEAEHFRESVIEWLMVNHPHDCPVCDEGGSCHLQDMTVMTGHNYRRYRFKKRTHRNQYLGPFINHEMNRCIACYRCVRFYRDYGGGDDLSVMASRGEVYFGRFEDGVLESEFSGNLVEVCPTGVFTDKTYKEHYTRKWDLQTAPSICLHCSLGCNTIPGERYGEIRTILSRYNGEVNGYFLCDRGRFGYGFVNSGRRIRQPLIRNDAGGLESSTPEAVGDKLASFLSNGAKMIGIGSPRASLEANFALRTLVGADRFYNGMSADDSRLVASAIRILQEGPARTPTLREVESADAVFVLGEDLTNTAPRLDLAVKQSVRRKPIERAAMLRIPEWDDASVRELVQDEKGPFFIATPNPTKLDNIATQTYRATPDDLARLGFAVAHALDPAAPSVTDLPDDVAQLADSIAQALKESKRPLVISGTSCASEAVMRAAANVAWALCQDERAGEVYFVVPECNSTGVRLMAERDVDAAIEAVQANEADTVIVLENDLYRRAAGTSVDTLLDTAEHVIAIDHQTHRTTEKAEAVLPAGTFAESDGTFVSSEGRAQRFYQVFVSNGDEQESWRWLQELMGAAGQLEAPAWENLDDITAGLAQAYPIFEAIPKIAPPAGFRVVGQKIPRQSPRHSGRTSVLADVNVSEPKPPADSDSPFSFSMEGYTGAPPSALISRFWSPGWNSPQAINKFQIEVGGHLHGGDPGRRLIEPSDDAKPEYLNDVPASFKPRDGELLIMPLYHIFGSDELSILAPAVAERSPQPYLALNPNAAASLQVRDGEVVEITLDGVAQRLPAKISPELPEGTAGLPVGLPGLCGVTLPAWSRVKK